MCMLDQQQKDSYKETPEPAFAGTGVSLSTDLFYSPLSAFLRREINMEQLNEIITKIDDFVWGPVMPSLLREYWE